MNLTAYQVTLLVTEWIFIYSVYRFVGVFFEKETCKNHKIEWFCYVCFMIINSALFIFCRYSWVRGLLSTLIVFLITFCYRGSMKKRIFATIAITTVMTMTETLLFILVKEPINFMLTYDNDFNIIISIASRLLNYIMILVIEKFHNLKKGIEVPKLYWLTVTFVLFSSMSLIFVALFGHMDTTLFPLFSLLLLCIDFFVFFLYDRMLIMQEKEEINMITDMENHSYRKQLEIMSDSISSTRALRHDIKNHIIAVEGLLNQNRIDEALTYIHNTSKLYNLSAQTIKTGNIELDSLLNYKLSQAEHLHIPVDIQVEVPENNVIEPFDLAVVLGNLFDNAIEALSKLSEEKRYLKLSIRYHKGCLLICSSNPYQGEIVKRNGEIATSKPDSTLHGIGLHSIETTIRKYNGEIEILTENAIFMIQILIYTN